MPTGIITSFKLQQKTPSGIKSQTLLVSHQEEDESIIIKNSANRDNHLRSSTIPYLHQILTEVEVNHLSAVALGHQQDTESALTQPPPSIVLICQGPSIKLNYRIQQSLMPHIIMILLFNQLVSLSFQRKSQISYLYTERFSVIQYKTKQNLCLSNEHRKLLLQFCGDSIEI